MSGAKPPASGNHGVFITCASFDSKPIARHTTVPSPSLGRGSPPKIPSACAASRFPDVPAFVDYGAEQASKPFRALDGDADVSTADFLDQRALNALAVVEPVAVPMSREGLNK